MASRTALVFLLMCLAFGSRAQAQQPGGLGPDSVVISASRQYVRSALWETLFGSTWRDVWSVPTKVPVLNLRTFAGGLKPTEKGGNQSRTLRFKGGDGRTYTFRSSEKFLDASALPRDLKKTPAGDIIQDQTSALHPSAALAASVLQDAAGVLNPRPELVVMPDDPLLGEFRDDFKGLMGQIEERAEEASDELPFAGTDEVVDTEDMLEELEESTTSRLDSRGYLRARLIDFIVGDTDRGADQWWFAAYEKGELRTYQPVPRDRDYAFMRTEGFLTNLAASVYPKLTRFRAEFPKLRSLVFMTREFDRSHLVELSWSDWQSVIADIQQRLTNDVIDRAIARIPEEQRRLSGDLLRSGLRARRDLLPGIAREYFQLVSQDADVFASDDDESAEIERNADGSVTVRIFNDEVRGGSVRVFERRFLPEETDEIRVFMERGNDRVVVRGDVDTSIEVRVIGGEGDDVLVDSSRVAHGDQTSLYDAAGNNTIVPGANTRIVTEAFVTPPPRRALDDDKNSKPEKNPRVLHEERRGRQQDLMTHTSGFVEQKTKSESARSYGKKSSWSPLFAYRDGPGLIAGFGRVITDYGFRRRPHEWKIAAHGMVGTSDFGLGARILADRVFENSDWRVSLLAEATQLQSNRFFGYGNSTTYIDPRESLVMRDEILLQPALAYFFDHDSELSLGLLARYTRPHAHDEGPVTQLAEEAAGEAGAFASLRFNRAEHTPTSARGFELELGAAGYPRVWDAHSAFGDAHALAKLFVPLGRPTLAFRAGGRRVWGEFPLHEAAFIGGRESLRGFSWNRFAGDAAMFGAAEVRLPLAYITLFTRGHLGVLGFVDTGRVWMDGESQGGWHTGKGAGLWFGTLETELTVTYARGEQGRLYFSLGYPF